MKWEVGGETISREKLPVAKKGGSRSGRDGGNLAGQGRGSSAEKKDLAFAPKSEGPAKYIGGALHRQLTLSKCLRSSDSQRVGSAGVVRESLLDLCFSQEFDRRCRGPARDLLCLRQAPGHL